MMGDVKPEMVAGENTVATAPPVQPRIAGPMPCVKCLYDLSGLGQDQKCPECGTAIHLSIEAAARDSQTNRALFCRGIGLAASAMICGPWVLLACGGIAIAAQTAHTTAAGHTVRAFIAMLVLLPTMIFPFLSARGWGMVAKARLHPCGGPSPVLKRTATAFAVLQPTMIAVAFAANRTTAFSTMNSTLWILTTFVLMATVVAWALRTTTGFLITIASLRHARLSGLAAIGAAILLLLATSVACLLVSMAQSMLEGAIRPIEALGYLGAGGLIGIVIALLSGGVWLLLARSRLRRHWMLSDERDSR